MINEISHASADVLALLFPLLESWETAQLTLPTGETLRPAPGFHVVATDNQPPDELPEALRDRFMATLRVTDPHPDALAKLREDCASWPRPPPVIVDDRRISARGWMNLETLEKEFGLLDACLLVFGPDRGQMIYDAIMLALRTRTGRPGARGRKRQRKRWRRGQRPGRARLGSADRRSSAWKSTSTTINGCRSPNWSPTGKGQQYEIIDSRGLPGMPSNGMTDKAARVMWVPLDASGRSVSRHELAHVVWSPTTVDPMALRVPMLFLRAIEDARVNLGLRHVGLPAEFDTRLANEIVALARRDLRHGGIVTFTLRAVAAFGTNTAGRIASLVSGDEAAIFATVRELIAETSKRLARARWGSADPAASFEQGVEIARWLAGEFRKRGFPIPGDGGAMLVGCCGGVGTGRGTARGRGIAAQFGATIADGVRPGRMRISQPVRPNRRGNVVPTRKRQKRASAEGVEVRYVHRFVSDQCVFARPARRKAGDGGTLLIDVSGSMSLSPGALRAARRRRAAGEPHCHLFGLRRPGEARVVARDGQAAPADLVAYGSSNVVDLPALQWLARQPAPRVWLSDGNVTGSGDVATKAISKRCREICAQGRIVRVRGAAAARMRFGVLHDAPPAQARPSTAC